MKFFYQLFFIFLLFGGQAFASEDPNKITNPFLWKATKNNQTIYLFGTQHTDINIKELPDEVFSYIDSSESFLTEDNTQEGMYTLDDQMERYASKKQLKIKPLDNFDWCDKCLMKAVILPVGLVFILAYPLMKKIMEKNDIKDAEEYRLGNESYIIDQSKLSKTPKSIKYFLTTKRHNKWMPKILESSKKGQAFVIAGVAHFLFSEDNILDRLKEEGFEVERVKMKQPVTHKKSSSICKLVFG